MSFPSNDSPNANANGTTETEANEGFETALNITPAVKDEETNTVHVDDLVDADSSSSSAPKKKNKKLKKKNTCLSVAGVAKATLAALAIGGTIGVIAGLLAPNRGGTSTQLQVAQNQQVSPKSPKSGRSNEFEVCVIRPVVGIFGFLVDICPSQAFPLPDQGEFEYEWKKYTRRCNDFWGDVIFSIKYITVYFVNNVVCRARRGLKVASDVSAPLTRALQSSSTATGIATLLQQAIMDAKVFLDSLSSAGAGVPSNMEGTAAMNSAMTLCQACNDMGSRIGSVVFGEKNLGQMIKEVGIDVLAEDMSQCVVDIEKDIYDEYGRPECSATGLLYFEIFNCQE